MKKPIWTCVSENELRALVDKLRGEPQKTLRPKQMENLEKRLTATLCNAQMQNEY